MIPTIEDIVAGLIAGTYTAQQAIAWLYKHKELSAEQSALAALSGVRVPVEPTDGLLMSIAMRFDHAIAMPGFYDQQMLGGKPGDHARRLSSLIADARRAHEEIVGKGFYAPEREDDYKASLLAASQGERDRKDEG
jgi:hypothetical protein